MTQRDDGTTQGRRRDGDPVTPPEHERAPLNVVGTFDDAGSARRAMEALERAGIDGLDIAIHGIETVSDEDAVDPSTSPGPAARTAWVAAAGGLAGGVVGGLVGALLLGDVMGVVPAAIVGALFLGGIGAALAAASVIGMGGAWHDTFLNLREGPVTVGVHTEDPEVADKAASVLEDLEADEVQRYRS